MNHSIYSADRRDAHQDRRRRHSVAGIAVAGFGTRHNNSDQG